MRPKINSQSEFTFQPSTLQITNEYYAKYEAISAILDEHPEIIDAVHRDLAEALENAAVRDRRGAKFRRCGMTRDDLFKLMRK